MIRSRKIYDIIEPHREQLDIIRQQIHDEIDIYADIGDFNVVSFVVALDNLLD